MRFYESHLAGEKLGHLGGMRGRVALPAERLQHVTHCPECFPCEIRRLPLGCHCNAGVQRQF